MLNIILATPAEKVGISCVCISLDDPNLVSYVKYQDNSAPKNELFYGQKIDSNSTLYENVSAKRIRRKYGIKTKIGRFISKFVNADDYYKDINKLVACLDTNNYFIEVVSGSDIEKYYLEETYGEYSGDLNKSCMRYEECQEFFKPYSDFPESVKMAILRKKTETRDVIYGRAILWNNVKVENNYIKLGYDNYESHTINYMDRIYSSNPLSYMFRNWAYNNDYFVSKEQGDYELVAPDENYLEINLYDNSLSVFQPKEYELYPYMDTFDLGDRLDNGQMRLSSRIFESKSNKNIRMLDKEHGCVEYDYCCDCCGEEFSDPPYDGSSGYFCSRCVDEGEVLFVDSVDHYMMTDETFYCEICECLEPIFNHRNLLVDGKVKKICESCFSDTDHFLSEGDGDFFVSTLWAKDQIKKGNKSNYHLFPAKMFEKPKE
ncbi:MAG: hypothetical protein ACRCZ9_02460 [Fusobacteriaceae bacterium]